MLTAGCINLVALCRHDDHHSEATWGAGEETRQRSLGCLPGRGWSSSFYPLMIRNMRIAPPSSFHEH